MGEWAKAWANDFWTFILAIRRHWVLLVTSSTIAAWGFFYEHTTKPIPIEYVWGMAVLFLFGACFISWREQYRQVLSRQLKRTIREGLAELHEGGVNLLLKCEDANSTVPDQEVHPAFAGWDRQCQTYLRQNLDRSYGTRFNNPVGLHLQYATLPSGERTRVWRHVANRTARLQQFMDDYKDS
jgi:hypothetical protein